MSTNRIQVQIQAIDDASAQIQKVRDSLTGLGNSGKGLVNISGMLSGIASSAMGFISAQVAMAGFSNSINLVKEAFIDFNATMETSRKSFENMLGSKDAAAVFINDLQAFAEATPFDFPELQQASKMMLGLGWAAKDILPALEAVGNAAANAGLSGGEISNIVMSISQMRGAGKIDAQNLKELDRRGVGATKILQDAYKMSIEDIQKSGKDVNEVVDTLVKGMNEKFKGAMETQQGTFTQMLSNVKDQAATILGEIGKPIFEASKMGLKAVGDMTGEISKKLREGGLAKVFEEMIPPEWQGRMESVYASLSRIGEVGKEAFNTISTSITGLQKDFDVIGVSADALVAVFEVVAAGVENLSYAISSIGIAIEEVVGGAGAWLGEFSVEIEEAFGEASMVVNDAWDKISEIIGNMAEGVRLVWQDIKSGIKTILGPVWDIGVEIFSSLGNAIAAIWQQIKNKIWEKVTSFVDGIRDRLLPLTSFLGIDFGAAARLNEDIFNETKIVDKSVLAKPKAIENKEDPTGLRDQLNALKTDINFEKGKKDLDAASAKANAGGFKGSGASGGGGKSRGGKDEDPTGEIASKLLETQEQAFRELKNESALISAKLIGDRQAQADAEFRIEVEKLAKQREEKFKDVTDKIAVEKWYNDQIALLEKERDEKQRDFKSEEFDNLIEFNQLEVDLRLKSQEEVNRINRDVFDKKIAFLKEELANENLTVEQIIELRKQLADVQQQKSNSPINTSEAFGAGLQQEADTWGDFFTNIKTVGQETARAMRDSFQEFFFDAMTGQLKSLGDYINSFLKGVARAISNALANAFAQKLIGSLFGNILPGKADGGPVYSGAPYIVGERGPELFVPSASGTIVPNHALKSASNSAPTVIVNVQNNLGVKAEVKQETKFDGQRYIVGVVLDAYTRNIGGMRTVMAGARG